MKKVVLNEGGLKPIVITALAAAVGVVIMTAPRMSVHTPRGSSIADTQRSVGDHSFTTDELQLSLAHNPEYVSTLKRAKDEGNILHVFLRDGEVIQCHTVSKVDPSIGQVTLTMPDSVKRPWSKYDRVVLKV